MLVYTSVFVHCMYIVCMFVCMHVCMYVCMYDVCMHVYTNVVVLYVCMFVCMYMYVSISVVLYSTITKLQVYWYYYN